MEKLQGISHPMGVGVLEWPGLRSYGYKPKTLMFFADIHDVYAPCKPCVRPACLKFPEFIKTLLREANQCIDVFIEDFPYHGKKKGGYRGYRGSKGSIAYTRYKLRKYRPAKAARKMFRYGRILLYGFADWVPWGLKTKKVVLGSAVPPAGHSPAVSFHSGRQRRHPAKGQPRRPPHCSSGSYPSLSHPNIPPQSLHHPVHLSYIIRSLSLYLVDIKAGMGQNPA